MKIVITGVGIVSAAGRGIDATVDALRSGRSGLGELSLFESARCAAFPVAEVTEPIPASTPRASALATLAARDALSHAKIEDPSDVALTLGICVGGLFESEPSVAALVRGETPDDSVWPRHECAYTTHRVARELGVHGPALTVSTACSSGAQALGLASELIRDGSATIALAGGVDAVTRLTFSGFMSLLAMDPEGCRPFDRDRAGMSLGEGAAFLVLESEASALERGVQPLAEFAGYGNSCDAHHPTAPDPEGRGAESAMRIALTRANVTDLSTVDYVNAHGTGTPDNDRSETAALRRVFGERVPDVSSTKQVFGHTLGAAGAIEAVVSVLTLTHNFLPGTPGFVTPDPDCLIPLGESRDARPGIVMSNSFGFGGNNTVLCLRRWVTA